MDFERSRPKTSDEGVLPLINIVFLLLIFFMLAGRLASMDPFQTKPPLSASEGPPQKHEMVVHVARDGRLALDGAIMDEAALRDAVATQEALRIVRLKADGRAAAARVVAVMDLLRSAGVEKLDLLTISERR